MVEKNKIRYALVTGGSRGIGRAIAERLACDGYYVVINYKSNDEAAQQILQTILQNGGQAELLKFDVTSPVAIQEAYTNWCAAHEGAHFDVLIHEIGHFHGREMLFAKLESHP